MNKFFLTVACLVMTTAVAWGQLEFFEQFDYAAGPLNGTGGWTRHSGDTNQVDILDTDGDVGKSLSHTGYHTPAGRRVFIISTETEDVGRNLSQNYNSGAVYASFLMKIKKLPTTTGEYFFHFIGGAAHGGTVWVRRKGTTDKVELGVNARTTATSTIWSTTELDTGKTHLVVVKYAFVSGSGNDVASLWHNPPLDGPEPPANVSHTNTGGTDLTNIGRIALRQESGMGNIEIDEIRVGRSWADAPLPIQLASFTASVIRYNDVEVAWRTISETNNYGFEIERRRSQYSVDGSLDANAQWKKIAFVEGRGTTLEPQDYSYIDRNVPFGKYYYRIRQIDLDGTSETFPAMEVTVGVTPDKLILAQNYPNPFNPSTVIEFAVPASGFATLKVYNVLGLEVATLFEGNANEGQIYAIRFDASKLSSGMYFYRLSSAGRVETKRMLLVK